jgi:hypothetical protein
LYLSSPFTFQKQFHVDHTIKSSEDDIQDIQNYKCIKAKIEKPILKVTGLNFGTDTPFLPDVTVHYATMIDLHEVASALFYTPDVM